MSTPTTAKTETTVGDVPGIDPLDSGPNRSKVVLIVIIAGVAATAAVWLYIIFGYRPELMIDELADRTFPRKAEQICSAAQEQLAQLPYASEAATASERADEVARSNVILAAMLADLSPIAPTEPAAAAEAVDEWLGDWETYLGDRKSYVENLRTDPKARFLETSKGSPTKGITRAITAFAQVNRMESCATPADLS